MAQFNHEELLDLCVGLALLVISLLLIGFFMARMARDEQDEYENVNVLCGCCIKKEKIDDEQREFSSLNDLLMEVDKDERARVVTKPSTTPIHTILERKESIDLSDTDHEDNNQNRRRNHGDNAQSYSFRTVFPNILQESASSTRKDSMEEPLLSQS